MLARIDASVYPASHVAYVNCQMSSEITAAGWQLTGGTATSALRFWEYQSVDSSGKAIDVSKRLAGSMQTHVVRSDDDADAERGAGRLAAARDLSLSAAQPRRCRC